jgi:hypothetical protein
LTKDLELVVPRFRYHVEDHVPVVPDALDEPVPAESFPLQNGESSPQLPFGMVRTVPAARQGSGRRRYKAVMPVRDIRIIGHGVIESLERNAIPGPDSDENLGEPITHHLACQYGRLRQLLVIGDCSWKAPLEQASGQIGFAIKVSVEGCPSAARDPENVFNRRRVISDLAKYLECGVQKPVACFLPTPVRTRRRRGNGLQTGICQARFPNQ